MASVPHGIERSAKTWTGSFQYTNWIFLCNILRIIFFHKHIFCGPSVLWFGCIWLYREVLLVGCFIWRIGYELSVLPIGKIHLFYCLLERFFRYHLLCTQSFHVGALSICYWLLVLAWSLLRTSVMLQDSNATWWCHGTDGHWMSYFFLYMGHPWKPVSMLGCWCTLCLQETSLVVIIHIELITAIMDCCDELSFRHVYDVFVTSTAVLWWTILAAGKGI